MKRFLIINTLDEILNITFQVFISENGYTKVDNPYLKFDDSKDGYKQGHILLVDTLQKEYCWSDNDSNLINNYFLSKFENSHKFSSINEVITLENIIRYAEKLDDCSDDYSDDIYLRNKSGEGRD